MPLFLVRSSRTPSAFQVSPYDDQPCRPCDCDPVGSLSSVCIKDDLHSDLAHGKNLSVFMCAVDPGCTCGLSVLGRIISGMFEEMTLC